MRDKFHVGQRVRHIPTTSNCTVASQRQLAPHHETQKLSAVYYLDVDGLGKRDRRGWYAAPESELRPIYAGDEVVSWSECAWRPKEKAKRRTIKA
jgi:hypothetical protein